MRTQLRLYPQIQAALLLAISAVAISACQTQETKPPAESVRSPKPVPIAEAPTTGGFMPACLNVTENVTGGERQIEFNNEELLLSEKGKSTALILDEGAPVRCEKLRVIEGAKTPSVEIVFMTRPTGTSIQIAERRLGIASIKDGKWLVKPFVLDRLMQDKEGLSTDPHSTVSWSEESGRPVMSRTDTETAKTEKFRP